MKFTFSVDVQCINFLDITLQGDAQRWIIHILPYRKRMARNSTLLTTSCHLSHVIQNLPVRELIRTKRNCSSNDDFFGPTERSLQNLKYPKWTIERAIAITLDIPRSQLLKSYKKDKPKEFTVIILSRVFSPQYSQIVQIIHKHPPI